MGHVAGFGLAGVVAEVVAAGLVPFAVFVLCAPTRRGLDLYDWAVDLEWRLDQNSTNLAFSSLITRFE